MNIYLNEELLHCWTFILSNCLTISGSNNDSTNVEKHWYLIIVGPTLVNSVEEKTAYLLKQNMIVHVSHAKYRKEHMADPKATI